MKMKGNEFQYHFPHQDDDDDGYLHLKFSMKMDI